MAEYGEERFPPGALNLAKRRSPWVVDKVQSNQYQMQIVILQSYSFANPLERTGL